jgi:hypothetical protein
MLDASYPLIDASHSAASWFLVAMALSFGVVFALPLLFAPLAWARLFQWELPSSTDLTVYFGRCLGGVAVAICVSALRAASAPAAHLWLFDLIVVAGALLSGVHVWGALQRRQPWTETVEIAVWLGATVGAAVIRAGL